MQSTVGLRLSDHIVSQVICQHPSLYIRTVQGQMYCILSKDTVANQMLKFCGGHIFLGDLRGDKSSANADIRRRLGRLSLFSRAAMGTKFLCPYPPHTHTHGEPHTHGRPAI